ncbi:FHA domain-containing protein [Myxococcota bacterium]|nr:FHA domain-containing protein [Myxococcota bacterium]
MLDEKGDRWEYPNALGETEHLSAYIVIQGPGHDGTRLALREGITSFGRLPSNDVILLGDLVSRHHSRITFFEGKATLQDLGSHNGSWVNGERVSTRVLKPGDLVRVGNFKLSFHEGPIGQADPVAFEETTAAEQGLEPEPQKPDTMVVARKAKPPRASIATSEDDDEPKELPDVDAMPAPAGSVLIQQIERFRSGGVQGDAERALVLLYRATEALAKGHDLESYARELVGLILDEIRADYAMFFRAKPGGEAELLVARDRRGDRPSPPLSMGIVRWVVQKNFVVTTEDASHDFRFEHDPTLKASTEPVRAVVCVPIASREGVLGALYTARGTPGFTEAEVDALSAIAHLSVVGVERTGRSEARPSEESLLREQLARFHAPDVVEQILETTPPGQAPRPFLDGKTATVCFCDIQGFTALTDRLPVEEMSEFLNTYLEQVSDIVLRHRGTIERAHGASMMSIFGAPFSYGNDAARAVAAALEMRDAFDALVKARPNVGPRRLRAGINTGWILAGTVGYQKRLEYTAIGDTVSAAERLEQSAAPGAILIGEATYPQLQELFEVRKLGLQQIRGRYEPMQVYEVIGRKRSQSRVK